jgi:hypothetical protein
VHRAAVLKRDPFRLLLRAEPGGERVDDLFSQEQQIGAARTAAFVDSRALLI